MERDHRQVWYEENEQAFWDDWALRILRCPRAGCRRKEDCGLPLHVCPGVKLFPFPEGWGELRRRVVRYAIEQRYHAMKAGPEADAALKEAWGREIKRMKKVAFQRARQALGLGMKGRRG